MNINTIFQKARAYSLLLIAIYTLAAGIIGTLSVLTLVNTPSFGALLVWSNARGCRIVNSLTPVSWPTLVNNSLKIGDCIEAVDSVPIKQQWRITNLLEKRANDFESHVALTVNRADKTQIVKAPALHLSLTDIFRMQISLLLVGIFCWLMATLVFFAQPFAESNRVFATLFWIISLLIFGQNHAFDDVNGRFFTTTTAVFGMSLVGVLIIHLALLVPRPSLPRFKWICFLCYAPAIISLVIHIDSMYNFTGINKGEIFARIAEATSGILMIVGLVFFLLRQSWLILPRVTPKYIRAQSFVLLISWICLLPLCISAASYLTGIQFTLGISLHTAIFLLFLPLTGTAYTMLRYQAFAYRGAILASITAVYASAAISCLLMILLSDIVPADGMLFLEIFVCSLATTAFWYVNHPFRRVFQRFFLRNQQHYRTALYFAQQITGITQQEELLATALRVFVERLQVNWAAIQISREPHVYRLMTHDSVRTELQTIHSEKNLSFPSKPSITCSLTTPDNLYQLGILWIGPRPTSEPLDDEDKRLATLLADYLSRTLLTAIQFDYLTRVPSMIFDVQEQERVAVGQDLHDVIAPFFSVLPFWIDQAQKLVLETSNRADDLNALLRRSLIQSSQTATELREIIGQLQPSNIAGISFIGKAYEFAASLSRDHAMVLIWKEQELADWSMLDQQTALHLYRVVQQAITNIVEHADASTITISIDCDISRVIIQIIDDGKGFLLEALHNQEDHYGLVNMRERGRAIGGSCTITSAPGRGTKVEVTASLPRNTVTGSSRLDDLFSEMGIVQNQPALDSNLRSFYQEGKLEQMKNHRFLQKSMPLLAALIILGAITLSGIFYVFSLQLLSLPICTGSIVLRCTVSSQKSWQRAGVWVQAGDRLFATPVSGRWTIDGVGEDATPLVDMYGYRNEYPEWTTVPEARLSSLIGRVGYGPGFPLGMTTTVIAPVSGPLFLQTNDNNCVACLADNRGSVTVVFHIIRN